MRQPSPEQTWVPMTRADLQPGTHEIIAHVIDTVPKLPVSVMKVIELTSKSDADILELAEVTMTDPVLSSKVLSLVNSAYYGLQRKIDNLRVAIVLLGFNTIRDFTIRNRFMDAFSGYTDEGLYNRDDLGLHSYLVSIAAENLSNERDPLRLGEYVTLSLLHDIGKFVLYAVGLRMRERGIIPPFLETTATRVTYLQLEESLFGVNHAVIGGMLAERWNLSERIRAAIEFHHHPSFWGMGCISKEYAKEISLICLSDIVVHRFMQRNNPLPEPRPEFFAMFCRKPSVDALLTPSLTTSFRKAEEFVRTLSLHADVK